MNKISEETLFITKADKGGATLILDYGTAVESVKVALANTENFEKASLTVTQKMEDVKRIVQSEVLDALSKGCISEKDKRIITGLNQNNNQMHAHVFKAVVPYVYPLYKLHKLTQQQILERTTPPIRLVHATREGPLYRLEKWVSPYLTEISRAYCQEEFLLDSPDLLNTVEELNTSKALQTLGTNVNLFTLDVISLYPSIKPDIALIALQHALDSSTMDNHRKATVHSFTDLIFKNAFVSFQDEVYTGKNGIPTGNCVSRQVADVTLHWLLFFMVFPHIENYRAIIRFWKRFIDDIIGIWTGTRRQFDAFIAKLNSLTGAYGIKFGDCQFGKSVDYLDVTFTLSSNNKVEYKLYKKETDARLYLKTDSFHPAHVFRSVVFSQMIRVIQRNSQDHTCVQDLDDLKQDLLKGGHNDEKLLETEPRAVLRAIENKLYDNTEPPQTRSDKVVFSVKYFDEIKELKQLVYSVKDDIQHLCGEVQITFAIKKQPSIGNTVLRNRRLSEAPQALDLLTGPVDQKCGGKGCQTCPYLFNSNDVIIVNGLELHLDFNLTCKDCDILYLAQCQICCMSSFKLKEDCYFGQTVTPMHIRMNGHRNKFKIDNALSFEKSALSMHCYLEHKDNFSMKHFKLGIVKKVRPIDLDREENKLINRYRTNIWGLNRIVVVR